VRPPKPGWFASYAPTMCNQAHEPWGGCNQCELTSGHEGPHMWRQTKNRTRVPADSWEWHLKLRDPRHAFSPSEKEAADVNDLARFGAKALPIAAERQAARVAAREVAHEVVGQVTEPAATMPTTTDPPSSLEMLTEAAAEAAEVPQSPIFSDFGTSSTEREVTESDLGLAGTPPMPPHAFAFHKPSPPATAAEEPKIERLARELTQKKGELANLQLEQLVVEGQIDVIRAAIRDIVA